MSFGISHFIFQAVKHYARIDALWKIRITKRLLNNKLTNFWNFLNFNSFVFFPFANWIRLASLFVYDISHKLMTSLAFLPLSHTLYNRLQAVGKKTEEMRKKTKRTKKNKNWKQQFFYFTSKHLFLFRVNFTIFFCFASSAHTYTISEVGIN